MANKSTPKPLGSWTLSEENEYFVHYYWECPFCGKREKYALTKKQVDRSDDILYDRDRCLHCGRDANGETELVLYRKGDCGYFGDDDWRWNGSWEGKQKILTHRPMDFDKYGWYGADRTPSDRPDIILEVHAWTTGGDWIIPEDGSPWKRKRRRIKAYSAWLKTVHWRHRWVQIVKAKPVKSLKQVYEEVKQLDLEAGVAELLKDYYTSKEMVTLVWKFEDEQWVPLMTSFADLDVMDLPIGKYATLDKNGRFSRIERSRYGSGSWMGGPDAVPDPPHPWIDFEAVLTEIRAELARNENDGLGVDGWVG